MSSESHFFCSQLILSMEVMDEAQTGGDIKGDASSKKCVVCGDKALGYNFNAVTCESCKAFFRRNALKQKAFTCPFENNCKVDTVTRRFCQKCRLRKCEAVGMRKDWIMTEEDKKKKREKIEENKRKKAKEPFLSSQSSQPASPALSSPSPHVHSQPQPAHHVLFPTVEVSDKPKARVIAMPQTPPPQPPVCVKSEKGSSDELDGLLPQKRMKRTISEGKKYKVYLGPSYPVPSFHLPPQRATSRRSMPSSTCSSNAFRPTGINNSAAQNRDVYGVEAPVGESIRHPVDVPPGNTVSSLLSPQPLRGICGGLSPKTFFGLARVYEPHCIQDEVDEGGPPKADCTLHLGLDKNCSLDEIQDPLDSVNDVLKTAICAEFRTYSLTQSQSRELNASEKLRLIELVTANEAMSTPIDGDGFPHGSGPPADPTLNHVINLTDIAIRRIIKMYKRINAFRNLCQRDQVSLLKGGCTQLMLLRAVMSFDPDNNSWRIPYSKLVNLLPVDVLKSAGDNLYEEHQRFLQSFTPEWRSDENIMLILGAIVLFTPSRPNVTHPEIIKWEQDSYYYLLRRYLESILPDCEAKVQYLQLIHRIQELHYLNEKHVRVYLEANPKEVEPLLIEIFDLKRCAVVDCKGNMWVLFCVLVPCAIVAEPVTFESVPERAVEDGREQYRKLQQETKRGSSYSPCWIDALRDLEASCSDLSDPDVLGRLAIGFSNCFFLQSGMNPLSCEKDQPIRKCLANIEDRQYQTYLSYFTHSQNMCHFIKSHQWRQDTEDTITRLSVTSVEVSNGLQEALLLQETISSKMHDTKHELLARQAEALEGLERIHQSRGELEGAIKSSMLSFQEFKTSTEEQRNLLFTVFERITEIQAFILTQTSTLSTLCFYATALFFGYALTSMNRTSSARFWVFILFILSAALERLVCAVSIHSTDNIALDVQQMSDLLSARVWYLRYLTLGFAVLLVLWIGYRFEDLNMVNNELLRRLQNQNEQIMKSLGHARKEDFSWSDDDSESTDLSGSDSSFIPNVTMLQEDDNDDSISDDSAVEEDLGVLSPAETAGSWNHTVPMEREEKDEIEDKLTPLAPIATQRKRVQRSRSREPSPSIRRRSRNPSTESNASSFFSPPTSESRIGGYSLRPRLSPKKSSNSALANESPESFAKAISRLQKASSFQSKAFRQVLAHQKSEAELSGSSNPIFSSDDEGDPK
ncbi:unnamed protein product [Cyprideis torosa]|uniref:Uncharacterized protein n=1 Tax=Cyprideis torosa TaxID=163714 RepID=A0A7R8WAU8_9CRUS|nr:unnamed protein product [Cyprideis torosa]CAG0888779.1 unnamed protein product [Cyprideis torosa]